jgi:3'(2'), 5'-bisphosphate nucleotidase
VAEGAADLYPRFGTTMEWDTAAAQAIVEAAGGQVLDMATGKRLAYGKPDWRNGDFLCTGAA